MAPTSSSTRCSPGRVPVEAQPSSSSSALASLRSARIEALGEPAVDGSDEFLGFGTFTLVLPKGAQRQRGPQVGEARPLPFGEADRASHTGLRHPWIRVRASLTATIPRGDSETPRNHARRSGAEFLGFRDGSQTLVGLADRVTQIRPQRERERQAVLGRAGDEFLGGGGGRVTAGRSVRTDRCDAERGRRSPHRLPRAPGPGRPDATVGPVPDSREAAANAQERKRT